MFSHRILRVLLMTVVPKQQSGLLTLRHISFVGLVLKASLRINKVVLLSLSYMIEQFKDVVLVIETL